MTSAEYSSTHSQEGIKKAGERATEKEQAEQTSNLKPHRAGKFDSQTVVLKYLSNHR